MEGVCSESHVGAAFVNVFGETLSMLRKLFLSSDPTAQPFAVSGSGTLGWDFVAANLVERGDDVLVLHTGSPPSVSQLDRRVFLIIQ